MKKKEIARAGNGRACITEPDHGPSIVMPSGAEWCPHHSHDMDKTSPWLDKQKTGTIEVPASA